MAALRFALAALGSLLLFALPLLRAVTCPPIHRNRFVLLSGVLLARATLCGGDLDVSSGKPRLAQ
jgi:hypothetical protein